MIVVTSLSPAHSNAVNQHKAVESWQSYGKCYSLNSEKEIEGSGLKMYKGIEIVPTHKTCEFYVGKPLVNINAFFDFAIEKQSDLLLVNSDIILRDLPKLKDDGVTLFSRYDYENDDFENSVIFPHGFDCFFIPCKFLKIFPPSIYALGACFYDLWIPQMCFHTGVPVYYPQGKFSFHKLHNVQYPIEEWYFLGKFFRWQFRYEETLPVESITTFSMNFIKSNLR